MIFLDANFFLRALTTSFDPEVQRMTRIAGELLDQADRGEMELTTSEAVIAEVAYILTAKAHYRFPAEEAAGKIAGLLSPRGLRVRDKQLMLRALDLWARVPKLGFVDALVAVHAQQPGIELATFDRHFDDLPGIARWQPSDNPAQE